MEKFYFQNKKYKKGFVMLFAVTLSAILLSIALGVATIAEKEIKFGTTVNDAVNAFTAADTGVECALFHDKTSDGANAFTGTASMSCRGSAVSIVQSPANFWTFALTGLGSTSQSCAKVTVDKRVSGVTTIISKGYNIGGGTCEPNNPTRTERQLDVTYLNPVP